MNEDRMDVPDLTFDLRYIRCAIAAAAHGSFRQTALALDTSQSTVTRRIQLLEHRLGFTLFVRDRRGVRLTHAGDNFLKEAAPGIDQLRRAVRLGSSKGELHNSMLRIGILASLAAGFLHLALKEVRRQHPRIKIILHEGTAENNLDRLTKGDLDIVFVAGLPQLPRQKSEILWRERIFAVLPDSHSLAIKSELSWEDIRSETFILSSNGSGPDILDLLVRKIGQMGFRPRIEVHHVARENLINLVAMGYGATVTSASALGLSVKGAVFRPIAYDAEDVPWGAVWSEDGENPAVFRFLEIVRSIAAVEHCATEPFAPSQSRDPSQ